MSLAPSIKGWCPGALRPMESGDGLIVRLRITGGVLSAAQALLIAEAAHRYGNGLIDLSGRANLQLRGVNPTEWPHLIEDLSSHGLIDQDAEAEAVRNVMASPLAGLDPSALLDIRPDVKALEARLINSRALHELPAKFGFLIDDGSTLPLAHEEADIGFEAIMYESRVHYAVRLAGAESVALIEPEHLVTTAEQVALAFISASRTSDKQFKRLKDWLQAEGAEALFKTVGLTTLITHRRTTTTPSPFGFHTLGTQTYLGVGAPFGRFSAQGLIALAQAAAKDGSGELRLTPWRAILIPSLSEEAAATLIEKAGPAYITAAHDPRLAVAACPGAPECLSASVPTHGDALAFATLFKGRAVSGTHLHVSGCEKGCARPKATKLVLVGRDGRYDLVMNGKASDTPVRHGLTREAAETALRELISGDAA
jgi:precorrin-3B synthase